MLTFQQIYEEVQEQVQDDSAATLTLIKRGINQGMQKFGAILNREWRVKEVTFSTVASQQYYQMPEDGIRPETVVITIGGVDYPLKEIADEERWNEMNRYRASETSDFPVYYHMKGSDLLGILPIPATSTASAGKLRYEPRMRRMTAADYTTGTITVANGSAAIVGDSTVFTAQMVGRVLVVEDGGDQEGIGHKIDSFTDTTHITLENYYGGLAGSGKSYRIGEVPDIPDEYHEALVDYACYRVYRRFRDTGLARDMKAAFDEAIKLCRDSYSSMSSSQYVRAPRRSSHLYAHDHNRDYTVSS